MSRALPAISRVRQTRYKASDGRLFDSHVEAFRHETYLALRHRVGELLFACTDAEEITRGLLDTQHLRIVLLAAPPASGGPEANRPLGRRSDSPGTPPPDTQATQADGKEFP